MNVISNPTREPVFANVPIATSQDNDAAVFRAQGGRIMIKVSDTEAVSFGSVERVRFSPNSPVDLLITQRDEPRAGVCTYGGLEFGEAYRNTDLSYDRNALLTKTPRGPVGCDGRRRPTPPDSLTVRRASVTVVEHEEPGTRVRRGGCDFAAIDTARGILTATREEFEAIMRQGVVILAGSDARCTYRGAMAECHDLHCPVHGIAAEDRSKPAPVYESPPVDWRDTALCNAVRGFVRDEIVDRLRSLRDFADDAQQAGKGGE